MEKTKEELNKFVWYQYDVAASLRQILDKNFNETLLLNVDIYRRFHFPFQ